MTHPVPAAEALRRAVAVAAAVVRAGRTAWIGVDGLAGAGKSTFAARLAAVLPGGALLAVDDFWDPCVAQWDWPRFERQVLRPLQLGRPARYQRWDWSRDAPGAWQDIVPGVPVVVEGVSATRREVRVAWDLTVWVEAPHEVRQARIEARATPHLARRWREEWLPSERAYLATQHPLDWIDLVVSGVEVTTSHVAAPGGAAWENGTS